MSLSLATRFSHFYWVVFERHCHHKGGVKWEELNCHFQVEDKIALTACHALRVTVSAVNKVSMCKKEKYQEVSALVSYNGATRHH